MLSTVPKGSLALWQFLHQGQGESCLRAFVHVNDTILAAAGVACSCVSVQAGTGHTVVCQHYAVVAAAAAAIASKQRQERPAAAAGADDSRLNALPLHQYLTSKEQPAAAAAAAAAIASSMQAT
jgi:hypothetical protein